MVSTAETFGRFRVLVVGRAGAGKTTLLQRICNTQENPEVFDGAGNKINVAVVKPSTNRWGCHDIRNGVVFRDYPDFVFHDSCGFKGFVNEFPEVQEFLLERASTTKPEERIHAIWQATMSEWFHLTLIFSVTGIASQWKTMSTR
ncbi:hypothetical protein K503DRAFT_733001 [Rhizopogon vinicolor AM-OR11-026]|uniref:Uncharacterized protein n=1 Tax=Rhizopogon vinicolor AM-OR11-026 TaxID=1314800 RepID=A0A1B7NCZ3_9AGAM|nr:hypothetical protein K503DRAFT_733001 [Rhizopogon vinicolor AM-OR11-026]